MQRIVDVSTGEVKAGKEDTILKSSEIGSCVVIAAYDAAKKVGALAHVMLPGSVPKGNSRQRTRYAAEAIKEILNRMRNIGKDKDGIEVCLVGGGNVLQRKDDTICQDNIDSVVELLKEKRIKIRARAVGGTQRRSVSLDVAKGNIYYGEGDEGERLLWKAFD